MEAVAFFISFYGPFKMRLATYRIMSNIQDYDVTETKNLGDDISPMRREVLGGTDMEFGSRNGLGKYWAGMRACVPVSACP
jgi:hypothetical protein